MVAKLNPMPKLQAAKEKGSNKMAKIVVALSIGLMSQSASANVLTSAKNLVKDTLETLGYVTYLILGAAFVYGVWAIWGAFREFKNMKDLKQRGHDPVDTWTKLAAGIGACLLGAFIAWVTASAGDTGNTIGPNTNVIDMNNFKIK